MKKSNNESPNLTSQFELAMEPKKQDFYQLKLYVTGTTPQSLKAIANIKKICDDHLPQKYELEVIDLYQHPNSTHENQIIATPTLLKKLPLPVRRIVGDLSDTQKVLARLDLD
jgi:circadian clock protein KaiB